MRDDPQAATRRQIRKICRELGLTQEEVAPLLGMSRLSFHRMERGGRTIFFDDLVKICAAFHCDPGELFVEADAASAFSAIKKQLQSANGTGMSRDEAALYGTPAQRARDTAVDTSIDTALVDAIGACEAALIACKKAADINVSFRAGINAATAGKNAATRAIASINKARAALGLPEIGAGQ